MRFLILLSILLLQAQGFSQSRQKREADLRKANKLEETHVFLQDVEDSNKRNLYYVENYDRLGRVIAKRTYNRLGRYQSYLHFEYPTDSTRVFISLSDDGRVLNKLQKPYDLLDRPSPTPQFNKNKNLKFEYNTQGQLTKVWQLSKYADRLRVENVYSPEGWLLEETHRIPRKDDDPYYLTYSYSRDSNGLIEQVVTKRDDGTIESKALYTHTSFTTSQKQGD